MSLSKFHHSLEGKDVGQEGADTITRLLLQQVGDIEIRFAPKDQDWEQDILSALRLSKRVEEGSKTVQAYILYYIKKHWDELSLDFRLKFNNQFDMLVYQEVGVLPTTMDEYLKTIDTFFVKDIKPFGKVEVPMRDQFKCVVKDEEGNVRTEFKEFDPASVSITKLNLARPLAEREQMDEKRWAMLLDPVVTVSQLQAELYKPAPNGNTPASRSDDPSLVYFLEGNIIVAREYGEVVEIGELFYDVGAQSDVARDAIFRLLKLLNIAFEQDEIAKKMAEAKNIVLGKVYESGGEELINANHSNNQGIT